MNHSGIKIFAPSAVVWPENRAPKTKSVASTRPPRMMMALRMSPAEAARAVIVDHADRLPIGAALAKDRLPGEPGLRALEQQELEEHAVVVHRHAPLGVVVRDAERRGRPGAAHDSTVDGRSPPWAPPPALPSRPRGH